VKASLLCVGAWLGSAVVVAAQATPAGSARFVERPGVLELSGRMIVRPAVRPGLGGARAAAARARLAPHVLEHVVETDEYVVRLPDGATEQDYAERLLATGDYQYVEPDWICFPTGCAPDDPAYPAQWHHAQIGSEEAWCHEVGSPSVVVAIVDGGVATDHPDLLATLVPGYNAADQIAEAAGGAVYDLDGHGTFIAGLVAATGDNGTDVTGVGWDLSIMPVRYYNSPGGGFLSDLLDGVRWAVDNGARVVNVSQTGVQYASVQTTGAYVRAQGGLLVYAAGNDGADLSTFDWPDVLVVGGTDAADALLSDATVTSATGLALDVFAPGENILSTGWSTLGTGLAIGSGTSASTALVSGLCGLLWSARPSQPSSAIEGYVTAGAVDLGAPGEDPTWGFGRIDSDASMQLALADRYGCGTNPTGSLSVWSGAPRLGTTLVLGVDNPLGTQSLSFAHVALATAPDPAFPCGTAVPGLGMSAPGAPGELLVGTSPPDPFTLVRGSLWVTPGNPGLVSLPVPSDPALAGWTLYVQGALVELAPGAVPVGLTDGLAITLEA
jgi:subtilisin family serine protease